MSAISSGDIKLINICAGYIIIFVSLREGVVGPYSGRYYAVPLLANTRHFGRTNFTVAFIF
jgi:hypothetical protein